MNVYTPCFECCGRGWCFWPATRTAKAFWGICRRCGARRRER